MIETIFQLLSKYGPIVWDLIQALEHDDQEAHERVADVLAEKSASRTVLEKLKAQQKT